MTIMPSAAKKEKLKRATHILAGLIILMHAYEKFESGQRTYPYFLIAGTVFISVAIFHHFLKSKYAWIDILFFSIEAFLSFIIAYEYFESGKKGLPYFYIIAGLLQLSSIYFFRRKRH